MPVEYERDDQRRLIIVTATEPYSVEDMLGVIDRQAAEDAWGYATLYDLRGMQDASTEANLEPMADRVMSVGDGLPRGPVGLAIRSRPELFLQFLTYALLVRELMTVEVLLTEAQVDAWLARHARIG